MLALLKRLWTAFLGWFGIGVKAAENPDALLEAAHNELAGKLRVVKQRAVSALQQRNQLEQMLTDRRGQVSTLAETISLAVENKKDDIAESLLVEQVETEKTVATLEKQVAEANVIAESVKKQVKQYEQEVYHKYQEQIRLKVEWKQAEIAEQLNEVIAGISADMGSEAMDRARERIGEKSARAKALGELAKDGVEGQVRDLHAEVSRKEARERLAKLKRDAAEQ